MQENMLLIFGKAGKLDFIHADFGLGNVDSGVRMVHRRNLFAGNQLGHGLEHFFVAFCVFVALVDDIIYTLRVKRKHIVSFQGMVYGDVRHFPGLGHSFSTQKVDGLEKEVHRGVEVADTAPGRHFRTNDNVGAHLPGKVHREVVAHTAVQQHLAIPADCAEIERNGHRRAHCGGQVAVHPVFGRHRKQIRGDAGVGDWQIGKADTVLIAYAQGTDGVAYIQSVQKSVGHAQTHLVNGVGHSVVGVVAGLFFHLFQEFLLGKAGFQVLVVVFERNADYVFTTIGFDFIGKILVRNVV